MLRALLTLPPSLPPTLDSVGAAAPLAGLSTTQGPSPLYQDPSISRHRGCNLVPKPQLRQTFLINLLVLKGDDSV
ncbi:unnamed protein product [Tetraodon nigroviridis]|uniref:(spotted green pufferfish) hypothetical protein n=1 Tax=Tetraodon nigroviridis TaxID=99883 RepID=Q4RM83_TETNG|nr:unnamed protein product [Tetraodon nigroviridis]